MDTDHSGLNKFSSFDDPHYLRLKNAISKVVDISLPQRAYDFICKDSYREEKLKISRLSGKSLRMNQCYINLATVELKNGTRLNTEGAGALDRPSQMSLLARLKVEMPDEGQQVDLSTLFKPRKGIDNRLLTPRRVLIRGRAGVGKTTLCKKIVHDFLHQSLWADTFDRLLWLPLRRLKGTSVTGWNLGDVFHYEFFSQHPDGRLLAHSLWKALDGASFNKCLFLLDGLDEVSEGLDPNLPMFPLMSTLLNLPNVIITSRPYVTPQKPFGAIDIELETIGFTQPQVLQYVNHALPHAESAKEVLYFLQHRRLIQSLVRIPIQLDALCYTWASEWNCREAPKTMTGLYRAIEVKLWREDVARLGKQSGIDAMNLTIPEIETSMSRERDCIELLAFSGLYSDMVDFDTQFRGFVYKHAGPSPSNTSWDTKLASLSFLQTSDPPAKEAYQTYHFIHLTFQEYFAAAYFVRKWGAGELLTCPNLDSESPAAFLRKHKYSARYDVFWRFVAGLLDSQNRIGPLFDLIQEEPRDLLGPTHQRLIIHCLSEVESTSNVQPRRCLELGLSEWLSFESHFTGNASLAAEVEFPENIILATLREGASGVRSAILESMLARPGLTEAISQAVATQLTDRDSRVRDVAVRVLSRHRPLPQIVLQQVAMSLRKDDSYIRLNAMDNYPGQEESLDQAYLKHIEERLEDNCRHVRKVAMRTLRKQQHLPRAVLQTMLTRLEHNIPDIREAVIEALQLQRDLPETAVKAIMMRLKDDNANVRRVASKALELASHKAPQVVTLVAARLEDCDQGVRLAAIRTLGIFLDQQGTLPEKTWQAISARLEDDYERVREDTVRMLGQRGMLNETNLDAIIERLDDTDNGVRLNAVHALEQQGTLDGKTLQAVAARLQDNDKEVFEAAINLCQKHHHRLPGSLQQAVVARLCDNSVFVRHAAVAFLGRQISLDEATIKAIAALLESGNASIRWAAIKSLRGKTLPDTMLSAIAARLGDVSKDVSHTASEILLGQRGGLDAVLDNRKWVVSLFKVLLSRSWGEPLSWYMMDDETVCVNMSSGIVTAQVHDGEKFQKAVQSAKEIGTPKL
ncbi:armadillo-type protein [Thelonectria olida]|uniref:Armadillo-type protein n=1 Tax=Thelonectria olida TaxID=1576542 RepID=A0A9P8W7F5_9HYPO|nr:armadillo-type protein [Thelonectria olida]